MAKGKASSSDRRVGAVKGRSQSKSPLTGTWTRRDDKTGKFTDVKAASKGVRKSKSTEVMERTTERFSDLMKRLAKR